MRNAALLLALLGTAATAHAASPLVNASCPNGLEIQAREGGVLVNGKAAKGSFLGANFYRVRAPRGITISMMLLPNGTPAVVYTGGRRTFGECTVKA